MKDLIAKGQAAVAALDTFGRAITMRVGDNPPKKLRNRLLLERKAALCAVLQNMLTDTVDQLETLEE